MTCKTISRISILVLIFCSFSISAQSVQKIGTNSFTIDANAVFELESTTKGFLPPRMTLSQQTTMGTILPKGLIVYIIDGATIGLQIWNGTSWIALVDSDSLALKAPLASPTFTGNVSGITATMVGLANVDNTSDLLKPIATAAQLALNTKEDKVNKSLDFTADLSSDIKYPSVKAVKTYLDSYASFNAITSITSSYTAILTDYTILCNTNLGTFQLTLPGASTSSGKTYVIRKTDESANILNISPSLKLTESTSISSLNYPKTMRVQSNGTDWYIID